MSYTYILKICQNPIFIFTFLEIFQKYWIEAMLFSYFCTQHLYYGQLYFGHYFVMVHPFRLNFLPQIECYMGSCLRYFLIKNILFKNKKCMLTFYGNISYIWYFKVLDSMPVFRVQVYENSSEMTYSCYQTISHHILHLLD